MTGLPPGRPAPRGRPPALAALLLAAPLLLAGCAGAPDGDAVRALPAEATLDARGAARGRAAERPVTVRAQETPDRGAVLVTAAPRLRTGSPISPPLVVTSAGAERARADGAVRYRMLVEIGSAGRYGGFVRATGGGTTGGGTTGRGTPVEVQVLARRRDCDDPGACLHTETLLLTVPEEAVRPLLAAGTGLRVRIEGNAAFVEAGIPIGHLRALSDAIEHDRR